ncbi:MAG: hypothetical protein U1D30_02485 [Planctomycetota bacterium]
MGSVGKRVMIEEEGTIEILGGARFNIGFGDVEDVPADSLRIGLGGILAGEGIVVGNLLNDGGIVTPMFSPGTLHVQGNYTQLPSGLLSSRSRIRSSGNYDQPSPAARR